MTIGSKARAARAFKVVKDMYEWQDFIDDFNRAEEWRNGDEDVWSADPEDLASLVLPKTYSFLGDGASRIAIKASDGLVYKVTKREDYFQRDRKPADWEYDTEQNEAEALAYEALKGVRVKGIRLAKTFRLTPNVNVAEYVEGPHSGDFDSKTMKRYKPLRDRFVEACGRKGWGASDMYYDNVKMNKYGTFVVVDIGCFYRKGPSVY